MNTTGPALVYCVFKTFKTCFSESKKKKKVLNNMPPKVVVFYKSQLFKLPFSWSLFYLSLLLFYLAVHIGSHAAALAAGLKAMLKMLGRV